ncbi:MAG TPA: tetratricopeptide repeat protein [Alphaproteobacteria bacterium]
MAHENAQRFSDAERDYLGVAAFGYRRLDVLRLAAGVATADGRLGDALTHWQDVLRTAPDDVPALRARGAALQRLGRWDDAVADFVKATALAPDDPSLATSLGVALQDAGRYDESLTVLRQAVARWPGEPLLRHKLRQAVSAVVPAWHVPMMNDAPRNAAFDRAIRRAVASRGPAARVLDIGTGSGILSMMAVRAGAASVVSCEAVPAIAEVARQILERNGYADRVRAVAKRSTELAVGHDLDEPADVLVSEILSSSVLSEYVLTTFEDAVSRLVKPSAAIIPRAVTAVGCLAGGPAIERIAFVDRVDGFDLSPFTALAAPRLPVNGFSPPWTRLSPDCDLLHFDLTEAWHAPALETLALPVAADGVAVGVIQWMRVELDEETVFVNPPEAYDGGGWQQVLHTFPKPMPVSAGQTFPLIAGHDRSSLIFAPAP